MHSYNTFSLNRPSTPERNVFNINETVFLHRGMEHLDQELQSDVITRGQDPKIQDNCTFCKITQGREEAMILFKNSEVTVFYNIKPASKEHLLVVPNHHIDNPKSLKKEDLPMVEYMHQVGRRILEAKGASLVNTRSGFHWPPFNSVQHLHLHMIYPESEIRIIARSYMLNSIFFVTYDWMIERLKTMPDAEPPAQTEKYAAIEQENTDDCKV